MNSTGIFNKNSESDNLLNAEPTNFNDLESITMQLGRQILQEWLESCEESHPKDQVRCCECGDFANYVSKRIGFIQTQFGLLRYKRTYYVCPNCHHSTCPLDERLDPVGSLARLRAKLSEGRQLPVAEIAKDWGLGSLRYSPSNHSFNLPDPTPENKSLKSGFLCEPVGVNSWISNPNI